jgi:hypothetical protein
MVAERENLRARLTFVMVFGSLIITALSIFPDNRNVRRSSESYACWNPTRNRKD